MKSSWKFCRSCKRCSKKLYALSDHFGPHSIFFIVAPDDECNFGVRMNSNKGNEIQLPAPNCTDSKCIQDFDLKCKKHIRYLRACSLDYQAAMQAVCELLGWDYSRNCCKGIGMCGKCKAFL